MPLKRTTCFPLRKALDAITIICAILSYFMASGIVNKAYLTAFALLIAWAAILDWRDLPRPPRLILNLIAIAAVLITLTRISRYYLFEALMETLMVMMAVKILEKRNARDYIQIIALGFAMLVSFATISIEKTFILHCFGMGIVCTLGLILTTWYSMDKEATISSGEFGQLTMRSLYMFLMMLPICLILFFLSPRSPMPIFGLRGQFWAATAVTGFSEQVQLGSVESLQNTGKLAFRVEMEELSAQTPYWRGMILDFFDKNTWMSSRFDKHRGPFIPEKGAKHYTQIFYLEPGVRRYLPALDQTIGISGTTVFTDGDGVFQFSGRNSGRKIQYTATSVLSSHMRPTKPDFDKKRYLQYSSEIMPRLSELAATLTQGLTSDREKAEAIMRHLRGPEFSYSLEGLPQTQDALEEFVFSTKRGNCEYFASAMGLMLRMTGVPARLIAGYMGGSYNDAGGYYSVQEDNAHVWVEAWDSDEGAWTRYDPTPPSGMTDSVDSLWTQYIDLIDYQWSKMVINYNWEMQGNVARAIMSTLRNPRASLTPTKDGLRRLGSALYIPAAVCLFAALCMGLFTLVRYYLLRKPEMVVLERFLRLMKSRGYTKQNDEGLEEFTKRIDDISLRRAVTPFVKKFEEYYFTDRPMNALTLKALRDEIDRIAAATEQA